MRYARLFVASSKHNLRTKPDMIETKTIYFWQMSNGVDAKVLYASDSVSPRFHTQSEAGHAKTDEVRVCKHTHVDRGVTTPLPAFSFSGNTTRPRVSA